MLFCFYQTSGEIVSIECGAPGKAFPCPKSKLRYYEHESEREFPKLLRQRSGTQRENIFMWQLLAELLQVLDSLVVLSITFR